MRSGSRFHRRSEESGDEGEADWMASYSDLITDLLAIFVVLFSFAMMSQAIVNHNAKNQTSVIVGSEGAAIVSDLPGEEEILPGNDGLLENKDDSNPEEEKFVESLNTYIDESGLSKDVSVSKQGDHTILLRVAASILFVSGNASITSDAEPILNRLSEVLSSYANNIKIIRIEGHTDNVPINTAEFDSNWELSSARAVNVVKRLIEISKINPEKFSAVGYAEFHPVAGNDTSEDKTLNRRVDFVIETITE